MDASALNLSDMGTMNNGGLGRFDRADADAQPAFAAAAAPGSGGGDMKPDSGSTRTSPSDDVGSPPDFSGETRPIPGEKDGQPSSGPASSIQTGGENGQYPEDAQAGNFSGGFPGGERFPGGGVQGHAGAPDAAQGSAPRTGTAQTLVLLGVSVLVLLAGLAAAFKFKR